MRSIALALVAPAVVLALFIAGCGGGDGAGGGSPSDGADAAASSDAGAGLPGIPNRDGGGALPGACSGLLAQPLDAVWTLGSDAGARSYRVHVPASYDPARPMPVVLDFHGYTSNGAEEEYLDHMTVKGDAAGFIVVQPDGLNNSWNAGACCGQSASAGVDDVGFVGAMVDALEEKLCVDTARVFATGMSNGGFMSHRLACELSDRIAAVAPVAGVNGVAECNPTRPVPVLHFHGTDDPTIPYAGNAERKWRSVKESTQGWVTRNACKAPPVETLAKGNVHCVTYGECKDGADVTLCTVLGGGHTWPGGAHIPGIVHQGMTTHDVSADDVIWTFFENHPMPAR
jgi:polyhydroxybutyrate depolymerase